VVTEAQAMRRPVIASDLGGPVETVEHGITGWRVPPGDAGALAAAIEHLLALPASARTELGIRARRAVQLGYTVAAMQAATLAVYDELLVGVAAVAA
jgi:glycosyltransferase involved in cell wall biosynthesis